MPEDDKDDTKTNGADDTKADGTKTDDGGSKTDSGTTTTDVTIKVDGVDKTFTMEELKEAASKVAGADIKFEEAAAVKKAALADSEKASRGLKLQGLMEEMQGQAEPNEVKLKEFMEILGVSSEEVAKILPEIMGKAKATADNKPEPVTMEQLDPRLRNIVEAAEQNDLQQVRENILSEVKKEVDKDEILSKMVVETYGDEQQGMLKQVLYDMVIDDVRSRIMAREPYGTEMIQGSLQKVRARVKNLGIPAKAVGQPPIMGELGVLAASGPEIRATEPIKRVPASDPGYEENAVKRLQQMVFQSFRKGGK